MGNGYLYGHSEYGYKGLDMNMGVNIQINKLIHILIEFIKLKNLKIIY